MRVYFILGEEESKCPRTLINVRAQICVLSNFFSYLNVEADFDSFVWESIFRCHNKILLNISYIQILSYDSNMNVQVIDFFFEKRRRISLLDVNETNDQMMICGC